MHAVAGRACVMTSASNLSLDRLMMSRGRSEITVIARKTQLIRKSAQIGWRGFYISRGFAC